MTTGTSAWVHVPGIRSPPPRRHVNIRVRRTHKFAYVFICHDGRSVLETLPAISSLSLPQGFVRKRILPVLFPGEEIRLSLSPIKNVSSMFSDAREGEELVQSTWGLGVAPPAAGSTVVDGAAGDGKLGILVAVSPGRRKRVLLIVRAL